MDRAIDVLGTVLFAELPLLGMTLIYLTKHEEAAIYAVNQRISNVLELRELFYSGAIRGYQMRGKIPFDPHILLYKKRVKMISHFHTFIQTFMAFISCINLKRSFKPACHGLILHIIS